MGPAAAGPPPVGAAGYANVVRTSANRGTDMAIELTKEVNARMVASIKRYFLESMEEEMGDLKASLLLDFCLKEIAPTVYNQAVADAQSYMQDKVGDLEDSCYQPEFTYWKR
jgi:uncharacterized protein (DUF2164 family)